MQTSARSTYKAKANVLKALAHPTRLWIVDWLTSGERCVCEFVDAANVDFSTISKHLLILKQAGIIEDDKRGKKVFYRLRVPCVLNFMECIESVLAGQVQQLQVISISEIKTLSKEDKKS